MIIFLASCFVLFNLSYVQSNRNEAKDFAAVKRDAHLKFADLLQQMIRVNELRFNAMKELTRLEDHKLSANYLRARDDVRLDMGEMSSPIVIILGGQTASSSLFSKLGKLFSQDTTQSIQSDSTSDTSSQSEEEIENGLKKITQCTRRSEIFCVKTASKICRRSCISAYKDACLQNRCVRRFKKAAKRNCRSVCKKEFNRGKYEDSDTD